MRNAILPALVVLATAGTIYAMSVAPSGKSEEETSVKLTSRSAAELTPYLQVAARELGYARPRGYDSGVFIDAGEDKISFFREKDGLTLHVALESRYRHARSERAAALQALESKGREIYETALQLQARAEARAHVASRPSARPTG